MGSFAVFGKTSFSLRQMHKTDGKSVNSGNGPTAGYAHGVRTVGVRFALPRQAGACGRFFVSERVWKNIYFHKKIFMVK